MLTVGTVEPRKDLPTIADAVERLRSPRRADLELVVVGPAGLGPRRRPRPAVRARGRRTAVAGRRRAHPARGRVLHRVAVRGLRAARARGDGAGAPLAGRRGLRARGGRRRRGAAVPARRRRGVHRRARAPPRRRRAARASWRPRPGPRRRAHVGALGRGARRRVPKAVALRARASPHGMSATRRLRSMPRAGAPRRLGGARPARSAPASTPSRWPPGLGRAARRRPAPAHPPRRRGALGRRSRRRAEVHAAAPDRRPARLAWEQAAGRVARRADRPDVWHGPHYTMPLRAGRPERRDDARPHVLRPSRVARAHQGRVLPPDDPRRGAARGRARRA